MAKSEFLQIASFANAIEAEQIRNVLHEHGVSSFIDGANADTTLSHVGSALGGVKIFVRTLDAERANGIIASLGDDTTSSSEAWFCGQCREEVDAGFEACWSCGNARAEVETAYPESAHPAESGSDSDRGKSSNFESIERSSTEQSNPYVSPQAPTDFNTPDDTNTDVDQVSEDMLLRAWRASIIGLVLFPVLTHFYSMYLLIHAALRSSHFSPAGQKRFYGAFAINLVTAIFWFVAISLISSA